MPKPYPKEFRDDVVRVALNREPGVRIKDIATDFAVTESCVGNWLAQAARDDGRRPGSTTTELAELRAAKKRIRLLEQEERGPAPGGVVSVPGEPAGKIMFPLVREVAVAWLRKLSMKAS